MNKAQSGVGEATPDCGRGVVGSQLVFDFVCETDDFGFIGTRIAGGILSGKGKERSEHAKAYRT
jgi:hypothetical protein